jgi:hypothetical protein
LAESGREVNPAAARLKVDWKSESVRDGGELF